MGKWSHAPIIAGVLLCAALVTGCATNAPASPVPSARSVPLPTTVQPSASASASTQVSPTPPNGTASSGITGRTTVDGGCPVVTDPPCPQRAIPARITVTLVGSDPAVASTVSASDGAYRISLPPGSYLVRVTNTTGRPLPRAATVTVTVPSGRFMTLNVQLDSGIR
jgi:hypothetical protein